MKRLYSIMVPAVMCAFSVTASAQTEYTVLADLTSKLSNADFSADEPINGLVRTYAKDLADDGLGAGGTEMYGQQPVSGWTATRPTDNIKNEPSAVGGDACAAAVFAYLPDDVWDDEVTAQLGGAYVAPHFETCPTMTGGKALGVAAVWGATVQYTQEITLAAGSYMVIVPVANTAGTGAIARSLNGFITAGETEYLAGRTSYELGVQQNDTIIFKLEAETTGNISVGYQASNIGSGSTPHLFIDGVQLYSIDEGALIDKEIADAKEQLLAVLKEGEQLGADTSAAQAVYDSDSATLDEVLAAIEAQKAINESSMVDLSDFFITNPHFNLDPAIADGICTYDYDMAKNDVTHFGMQPLSGWVATDPSDNTLMEGRTEATGNGRASGVYAIGGEAFLGGAGFLAPQQMSDGTSEGKILGFLSVWNCVSQYKQNVSIPAGKYTLTISYYNAGGKGEINKNLMGFITDSGVEYLADTKVFKEHSWEKMKIIFDLEEPTAGYFSLGFKAANASSGSMPHFFIDGISLNYVGDLNFDPSLLALQAIVSSQTPLLDEAMNAELHDQLSDALSEGAKLVSSQSDDEESNKAALEAISSIINDVHASIEAYKKLQDLISTLEEESADEELGAIGSLGDLISEMLDEMMDAYDDGSLGNEEIEAAIAHHAQMLTDEIRKTLNSEDGPGTNITGLLSNPGFNSDATGWEGSMPTVRAGVAEFYNKTFDMYQTLTGLPNGKYEIRINGFHRFDNNDNTLAAHKDGTEEEMIAAYVYGNNSAAKFKSVYAGAATDNVKTTTDADGTEHSYVYYSNDVESEIGFVPNSMEGFAAAEEMTDAYETTTSAIVTDGTLRIGVRVTRNPSGAAWTIFDSFRLKYVGNQPSDYAEHLLAAAEELQAACDAYAVADEPLALPADTKDGIASLCEEAALLADNATSTDDCIAMLGKIADAGKHLTDVAAKVKEYVALVTYYESAVLEYEVDYDIDGYYAKMCDGWATEEELDADIVGIDLGWAKTIQEGNAEATGDNPFEVTKMLRNPGFTWNESDNKSYWNITNDYGDASNSLIEFYGKTSWEISQKVNGLAAGWYLLSVQAAYRTAQQLSDAVKARMEGTEPHDVYVFASNGETEWKTGIMNILDSEQDLTEVVIEGADRNALLEAELVTKHHTYAAEATLITPTGHDYTRAYFDAGYWAGNAVVFEVNDGDVMTLGAKKEEVNTDGGNWTPLDNFQLFYLGTSAPDAIKPATAVGTARSQAIYTIDGIRLARPAKGVNIIVTTNADGSKTVAKAVVK